MTLTLESDDLDQLYPAYVAIDHHGVILACGPSLRKRLGGAPEGNLLSDLIEVVKPSNANSVERLQTLRGTLSVRLKAQSQIALRGTTLTRGQTTYLLINYVLSPADESDQQSYSFADFPPSDGSADLFLAARIRDGLLEDAQSLTAELKKEKLAAEMASIAKSSFLACMSHELRTPMNGVLAMLDLLLMNGLGEDDHENAMIAKESAQSLLVILNDILDFSKLEAGEVHLETLAFDPLEIASKVIKILAPNAEGKGVSISVQCEGSVPSPVFGDPTRLRQVLFNLIGNAVKFTNEGQVRLAISYRPGGRIHFEIHDTGIGIDLKKSTRLFQRFAQGDSSTTRNYGGTGLGLAICKQLVELMGGTIGVESELGGGSCFWFEFPAPTEFISKDLAG